MKTDKELIISVVNDPTIEQRFKYRELDKLEICKACPNTQNCWSCGCREWWKGGEE